MTNTAAVSQDARTWGMLCHLSALSGLVTGLGFLLGPLVIWLIKKDEDPFIDEQGKEAVNFQITILLAFIVAAFLAILVIGFLLMPLVGAVGVIMPIIGGIKANNGENYKYPFALRLIK